MYEDPNDRQTPTLNPNYQIIDINQKETAEAYIKSGSTAISSLPEYIPTKNNLKIKQDYIVLKPFYSDDYLARCSNAYLFDDVINSAIERLAFFTLGTSDEIRSVLYPESLRQINSELEAKNSIKELDIIKTGIDIAGSIVNNHLSDQEIKDFETFIHYTDKNCKLGRFLKKNYRAAHVFGRSASYIEKTPNGIPSLKLPPDTPIGLKPLKPMFLGNVAIDPDNWEIEAVEYKDPKVTFKEYGDIGIQQQGQAGNMPYDQSTQPKYLDAENLLYFVRNNNNMMKDEDDFFFGHSTIQPIMSLSEESRRINQIVIPQINQAHWAGSGIWYFNNWTVEQMDKFLSKIKPGGHIGVPQKDINFQEMKLNYDYPGIISLRNELKKGILTAFGLPSFLMNFEEVTNRATAETVVIGFNESTIQSERSWITDILDEQWYPRLFKLFYPADEFIHIKMKMVMEFENISFESFLQKAVATVSLFEKGMMTLTECRNLMKLPPLQPKDYVELGLAPPGQAPLTDPLTQGVPPTPNLVAQLTAQQKRAQAQDQTASTGGGGGSALTQAKAEFMNESGQ
jgi:hypothetical protein